MLNKKLNFEAKGNILAYAEPYVAISGTLKKGSGTEVAGRSIVKGGTVYPKNDATAKGLVLYDVDVTDGDVEAPILVEGYVYKDKLPVEVNAEAKLTEIKFI